MSKYHFDDASGSDQFVKASLVPMSISTDYRFVHKHYPDIYIPNRSFAWHLSFQDEKSEEVISVQKSVEEYNSYLTALEAIPGFVEYFIQSGFCVKKEDITNRWSEKEADFAFTLKSYRFFTELTIIDDYLFDNSMHAKYRAQIGDMTVELPVGKPSHAYPDLIAGKKAIWNWTDTGHDFCFFLWQLLGERTTQYDDFEENEGSVQYYFEVYDQIREDTAEPQLCNIFRMLESLGYIESWTITPSRRDPRWNYYGKSDGSIDLSLIDTTFLQNSQLMDLMNTRKAKELAESRHSFMEAFLREWTAETEGQGYR